MTVDHVDCKDPARRSCVRPVGNPMPSPPGFLWKTQPEGPVVYAHHPFLVGAIPKRTACTSAADNLTGRYISTEIVCDLNRHRTKVRG